MRRIELSQKEIEVSKFAFSQISNEKARRQFLALQADSLGYGGISAMARIHGVSRQMISRGKQEIDSEGLFTGGRQRKEGAGRPTYSHTFSENMLHLIDNQPDRFISSHEPQSIVKLHTTPDQIEKEADSCPTIENPPATPPQTEKNDSEGKKPRKRRGLDIDKMIENHSSRLSVPSSFIILPQNPLDPELWIEQIVQEQFAAVYGNPVWPHMYVNLTLSEIKQRFEYRTQQTISIATLWKIMHSMGFSVHKNVKYEQVGKPHPLRNEQFIIIQTYIDKYRQSGDIILSTDSKAAVKLGCFYANGKVWCPEYCDPRVLDHDFAFRFDEIYPNGTDLIPQAFMKEKAIVKISGVYDTLHNSAHVTVGISKDTSEFAGASLINAWNIAKQVTPSAKRILILGDGGGSNRTSGFLWKNELATLSRISGLPVMMCHYPPGCSKYDPIEHRVWGPVSKNWSGSPLLDCERVLAFLNNTTTKTGLKVSSQLDVNEYLTQTKKKELGIPTISEKEFALIADIEHPHKEKDLATWNYLITAK